MQALVDRHRQFVDNKLTNGKPVKFTQDGRNGKDNVDLYSASSRTPLMLNDANVMMLKTF